MARPAKLERLRRRVIKAKGARKAFWSRSLARNRKRYLTKTVAFDGTPTMRGLALLLTHARRHGWNGFLQSSDRRRGVAERFGKRSQYALWRGWIARLAGFNPANPPGRSSHELRSDGNRVYGVPAGGRLPWFMLGLDVSDATGLLNALHAMGVRAERPYPSGSEEHHVNVLKDPTQVLAHLGEI